METLYPWMESLGFEPGCNEKSLFYHPERDLTALIYVDDCLAVGEEEFTPEARLTVRKLVVSIRFTLTSFV